jgi:ribosomal subunit interface protein
MNNMNIEVSYFGMTKQAMCQQLVAKQLGKLQKLASIAKARVRLEWQHDVKRVFRVLMLLEVPGPDFHAEASGYTLPAALAKVVMELEKQMRTRKSRREAKWKMNRQLAFSNGR